MKIYQQSPSRPRGTKRASTSSSGEGPSIFPENASELVSSHVSSESTLSPALKMLRRADEDIAEMFVRTGTETTGQGSNEVGHRNDKEDFIGNGSFAFRKEEMLVLVMKTLEDLGYRYDTSLALLI